MDALQIIQNRIDFWDDEAKELENIPTSESIREMRVAVKILEELKKLHKVLSHNNK